MSAHKPILAVAGDIGGARAILPGLVELARRGTAFTIADHRFLAAESPAHWPRVRLSGDNNDLREALQAGYRACLFGTSVADPYPLRVARAAQMAGLPAIAVLDNWMNYRKRLETDGHTTLLPDAYAVMDELAKTEALLEGIPAESLRVVGHGGIASLAQEVAEFRLKREQLPSPAVSAVRLVAFISEPAEQDQGADDESSDFRGYTEKTVLRLLAECLQPYYESVEIGLVPHPRENAEELTKHWEQCRGKLTGGVTPIRRGRDAVFTADAVCGMSSLLLLEAFLLGKSVLSLQPDLRIRSLDFLKKKGLVHFVTDANLAPKAVREWITPVIQAPNDAPVLHPELDFHRHAASNLADLVQEVCGDLL